MPSLTRTSSDLPRNRSEDIAHKALPPVNIGRLHLMVTGPVLNVVIRNGIDTYTYVCICHLEAKVTSGSYSRSNVT